MGLVISAKGFNEEIYDSGYGGFTQFRIELAKAYNKEFGELYERWLFGDLVDGGKLTHEEYKRFKKLSNKKLDILLHHSDGEGVLKPWECKKIYSVTKKLKCNYPQNNYMTMTGKNQLEVFNRALYHCWKKRVKMVFH